MCAYVFREVIVCFETFQTNLTLKGSFVRMDTLVPRQPEVRFKNFPTIRARVRSFVIPVLPKMRAEVLLTLELFVARGARVFHDTRVHARVFL